MKLYQKKTCRSIQEKTVAELENEKSTYIGIFVVFGIILTLGIGAAIWSFNWASLASMIAIFGVIPPIIQAYSNINKELQKREQQV